MSNIAENIVHLLNSDDEENIKLGVNILHSLLEDDEFKKANLDYIRQEIKNGKKWTNVISWEFRRSSHIVASARYGHQTKSFNNPYHIFLI